VFSCQFSEKGSLLSLQHSSKWYSCSRNLRAKADFTASSPPKSLTQKVWVYNDGSGDVGDTPSQFLLVRSLDTILQEQAIAKGMAKLNSEPKRVLLIRDRKTRVSWGFAFVEYENVSFAQSALDRYIDLKSFKIDKSKVQISFCHPGVFVPVYADSSKYSFKVANGLLLAYWDEYGFASEWTPPEKECILTPEAILSNSSLKRNRFER
jgi:RNA recognition motif-containing protein